MMTFFLQSLVNGILLGGMYAACSVGFSLAFGVMGIVNLSHGDFVMLGAFVTYWLFVGAGLDPFLTLPFCLFSLFTLGWLLQRFAVNRLVGSPPIMTYLLTFGFHLILANSALRAWTADYRTVSPSYAGKTMDLLGLVLPYTRLGTFFAAMGLILGLSLLLYRTEIGRAIRATAQARDEEMADRIRRHRESRGPDWQTLEEPLRITEAIEQNGDRFGLVLIDCLTLWLSNAMMAGWEEEKVMAETDRFLQAGRKAPGSFIFVGNEVGWGIVPENPMARAFRDMSGRMHQRVAREADEVYLLVCGIPQKIKGA